MSTITVRFNADTQEATLDQSAITLTNDIDSVIWEVEGLPPGASASIHFDGDGSGPFQELVQHDDWMIGLGNRGPGATLGANFYPYRAELQPADGASWSSSGLVINQATAAKAVVIDNEPLSCDQHPGEPPCPAH